MSICGAAFGEIACAHHGVEQAELGLGDGLGERELRFDHTHHAAGHLFEQNRREADADKITCEIGEGLRAGWVGHSDLLVWGTRTG
ncbi:MAG: hypothetical protein B7X48_10580 [Acidiphilium sp. 34-60-192]|nr:MAG: hypothetical protein B7X48_10580 [Acidiphilium sp. 34-60-192]